MGNARSKVLRLPRAISTLATGQVMQRCLTAEFFMSSDDCLYVLQAGHAFLKGYQTLATLCYDRQLCLYKFRPKIHYLNHIFLLVKDQWEATGTAVNPVAEATFMSEDFVGHASRLSRRVNPRAVAKKTLQRYNCWVKVLLDREEGALLDLSWLD